MRRLQRLKKLLRFLAAARAQINQRCAFGNLLRYSWQVLRDDRALSAGGVILGQLSDGIKKA